MRALVVRAFKDKSTKSKMVRKVGDVITVTKERFEDVNSTALGAFLAEIPETKPEGEKPDKAGG